MKVPFDIKYKTQIESKKYQVVNRNDTLMEIVCWNAETINPKYFTGVTLLARRATDNELTIFCYDEHGKSSKDENEDLFVIIDETANWLKEDYVSFETMKLLKEKGFIKWFECRFHDDEDGSIASTKISKRRVTLNVALKWLREEHNVFVDIYTLSPTAYIYRVALLDENNNLYEDYACEEGERFMSYNEAVEFALEYVLTNII